jgi:hypothetical protein
MNNLDSKSIEDIGYKTIQREVVYYEKRGDKYIGNYPLPKLDLDKIRKIWNQPDDDPMVFVFPITTSEQIALFEEILGCKLDIDSYDYFLETA